MSAQVLVHMCVHLWVGMGTPAACMPHALPGHAWQDRGNILSSWLPPGPLGKSRFLFCLESCFVPWAGLKPAHDPPAQPPEGWDFKHMISGPGPLKSSAVLASWWSSSLSHRLIHEVPRRPSFLSPNLDLSLRFLKLQ